MKQIKAFLLDKCEKCSKQSHEKLYSLLNDDSQQVGLLLSERFINIPPQISVPSYESLWWVTLLCTSTMPASEFALYPQIFLRRLLITDQLSGKFGCGRLSYSTKLIRPCQIDFIFDGFSAPQFLFSIFKEKNSACMSAWTSRKKKTIPNHLSFVTL